MKPTVSLRKRVPDLQYQTHRGDDKKGRCFSCDVFLEGTFDMRLGENFGFSPFSLDTAGSIIDTMAAFQREIGERP
jgi:hypothetical protein